MEPTQVGTDPNKSSTTVEERGVKDLNFTLNMSDETET